MIEIAWARRVEDGKIVGVDRVAGGLACACVCTQCERPLLAAKGEVYRHHFRHHTDGFTCSGGQETALHVLAKDIVMRAHSILLPDDETRVIVSAVLEPTLGDVRPDVLIHTPQGSVAIEVAVEHRTGEGKKARLANMNLAAVEIDISVYRGVLMTEEELREAVLSTAPRNWLKARKERDKPASPRTPKNWIAHGTGEPDDFDVPPPEHIVATSPPSAPFLHHCHCGSWGSFGYGVDLLQGREGVWYCARHRLEMMRRTEVP